MRSKPRRSLQEIRTMTDLVSETKNPQRKFLKLAALEIEKVRRGTEAQSARSRLDDIDKRLAEIEAEQSDLLEQVSNTRHQTSEGQRPPNQPAHLHDAGFVLRY